MVILYTNTKELAFEAKDMSGLEFKATALRTRPQPQGLQLCSDMVLVAGSRETVQWHG